MNTSIEALMKAAQSVPVVGEPVSDVVREYTTGRWHHGNGFLCMGTLRIARADLDTNPSAEVQSAFFDEICATLNAPIPATLREKAKDREALLLMLEHVEQERDELRKDAEKRDAREDRHWRAGFMDGWNAGVIGDESALKAAGERLDAAIAQGKGE